MPDPTPTEPRPLRAVDPEQVTGWLTGAVLLALTTFLGTSWQPVPATPARLVALHRHDPECGFTAHDATAPVRALYLPAWQDWRHEAGAGYACFASPPAKDVTIVVAEGGLGRPDEDLGGGWWWVESS